MKNILKTLIIVLLVIWVIFMLIGPFVRSEKMGNLQTHADDSLIQKFKTFLFGKKIIPKSGGCPCGYPNKRVVDAYGGHHILNEICAKCGRGQSEPAYLGTWWQDNGHGDVSKMGLNPFPKST